MKQFCICLSLLVFSAYVVAHESRPVYFKLTEVHPNYYSLVSKLPGSIPAFNRPSLLFPNDCTFKESTYQCQQSLQGRNLKINYPLMNPSVSALLQLQLLDGQRYSKHLGPEQNNWQVPDKPHTLAVARDYTRLGIEHILSGFDHLLFVACLVFIASSIKRIVITLTGFTIAHSITLAAASLNLVRLPGPAVEACIALSLLMLARELLSTQRDSLTWRAPMLVACAFGLLHGFGFAAVLAEIGLPQSDVSVALLFFNIGIELGQLSFVAILIALFAVCHSAIAVSSWPMPNGTRLAAYIVGTISGAWFIERLLSF